MCLVQTASQAPSPGRRRASSGARQSQRLGAPGPAGWCGSAAVRAATPWRGGGRRRGDLVGTGRGDAVQDGAVIVRDVVDLHPFADLEIGEHPPVGGLELHPVRELDDLELGITKWTWAILIPLEPALGPSAKA